MAGVVVILVVLTPVVLVGRGLQIVAGWFGLDLFFLALLLLSTLQALDLLGPLLTTGSATVSGWTAIVGTIGIVIAVPLWLAVAWHWSTSVRSRFRTVEQG